MKKKQKRITTKIFYLGMGLMILALGVLLYIFAFNGVNKKSLPSIIESTEEIVAPIEQNQEVAPTQTTDQEQKAEQEAQTDNVAKPFVDLREELIGITEDKRILLKMGFSVEDADLIIRDSEGNEKTEKVKGTGTYVFTDGVHGTFYTFELKYKMNDQDFSASVRRKFLDFDKLPELMTLYINTEDGRDPYYTRTSARQEHLFGLTIKDNNFKNATLNNNIPLKIRVRGNSSAYGPKKSYKLVFEEEQDMLGLGQEYADKEWLLLGKSALQTYLGFQIGKFAGMEWEPRVRFVNVMMNGDWKGLYILCESIKKHPKRVALDEDGFLIEGDGYWWKETGVVLESDLLSDKIEFTFKYPKPASKSDERFVTIEKRIQQIESSIERAADEELASLVDLDMFASWLLAHEIMGTSDGFGSNMFFYQKNFNKGTKLKMGPVWDFDTMFFEPMGGHSKFWALNSTYFPRLLEKPEFRSLYKKKYFDIVPSVEAAMKSELEKLKDIPGLNESMKIDRYTRPVESPIDAETTRLIWKLHDRIEHLSKAMEKMSVF